MAINNLANKGVSELLERLQFAPTFYIDKQVSHQKSFAG